MSKAEELIACLEGEIAKRDARIMGLESQYQRDFWREKAIAADDELAAIKAQEPVAYRYKERADDARSSWIFTKKLSGVPAGHQFEALYAAPVSEAKAQGVYSTDPLACTGCASGCFRCLNAAHVQQASVPAWMASSRAFADRLYMAGWRDHADAQHSGVAGMYDELLSAAPAAPAADAPVRQATDGGRNQSYEGLFDGETEEQRASRLAAHSAKGVV